MAPDIPRSVALGSHSSCEIGFVVTPRRRSKVCYNHITRPSVEGVVSHIGGSRLLSHPSVQRSTFIPNVNVLNGQSCSHPKRSPSNIGREYVMVLLRLSRQADFCNWAPKSCQCQTKLPRAQVLTRVRRQPIRRGRINWVHSNAQLPLNTNGCQISSVIASQVGGVTHPRGLA